MLWMQQSSCFVGPPQNTELQDVAAVKSQRRFASARWFRALTCDHRPAVRQSTLSAFPGWFRPVQRGGGVSVWLINMQQHKDQKRCEHRRSFLAGWESSVCVFSSKRKLFLFLFFYEIDVWRLESCSRDNPSLQSNRGEAVRGGMRECGLTEIKFRSHVSTSWFKW